LAVSKLTATSPETDVELVSLRGRHIVLGVAGGIAAYKAIEVCRQLVDAGAHVVPVLTDGALHFVGALTFSALASEPARTALFEDPHDPIPHTRLGQRAQLIIVAPATATVLAKHAQGIGDDLLTATLLATRAPVLVAPAMHTEMWEQASVQENLETLRRRGVHVVGPASGRLAGGDQGIGRMSEPHDIVAAAAAVLRLGHDLSDLRVLVTAGGTREAIDPVRYVGNRSSGKMGTAIADAAAARGAAVTLVTSAPLRPSDPSIEIVEVETAQEMHDAALDHFEACDVVVMAAAVADFRPKAVSDEKLKKHDGVPEIVLEPTPDILRALAERRTRQYLVGFAAETSRLREHASDKLRAKQLDLLVANDVTQPDAGFAVDTNRALLLDSSGGIEELPLQTKRELADRVLDRVLAARTP
jgi:phosphopantothenoylcysteine decarboxylase/phosphopantothenate--cysteine ligase